MSIKLTKYMRDDIAKRLLSHKFTKDYLAIVEKRKAFAEELYNDIFSAEDRKKMYELPNGWLPEESSISFQIGGGSGYTNIRVNGSFYSCELGNIMESIPPLFKRVPNKRRHGALKVYDTTSSFSIRYTKLENETQDLIKQVRDAQTKVESALASVTTIGKLIQVWPEIKPFTNKWINASAEYKLPAIPVQDLNETFELPVEENA